MAIRLPTTTVLDEDNDAEVGAGSVAGGVAFPFKIPQDTDNVIVKFTASVGGGGVSATFQTSDDGGTTYYDVARTSIVSRANNAVTAEWLSIPVISSGLNPRAITLTSGTSSLVGGTVGQAGASTLGSRQVSGLPILGQQNRVFLIYTAAVDTNTLARVQVKVNSQSATA